MKPIPSTIEPLQNWQAVMERGLYLLWIGYAAAGLILTVLPTEAVALGYLGDWFSARSVPLPPNEFRCLMGACALSCFGAANALLAHRALRYGRQHLRFEMHQQGLEFGENDEESGWNGQNGAELRQLRRLLKRIETTQGFERQEARNEIARWISEQAELDPTLRAVMAQEIPYLLPPKRSSDT